MRKPLILLTLITVVAAITAQASVAHNGINARWLRPKIHPCLAKLIDRENPDWNPTAYNRQGSGAYGLPQALPGSKMASEGDDWRTNPVTQIRWMLKYVNARYGGACNALQHSYSYNWY